MRHSRQKPLPSTAVLDRSFPAPPRRSPIRFDEALQQARNTNVLDLRGIGSLLRPPGLPGIVRMPTNFGLPMKTPARLSALPAPKRFPFAAETGRRRDVGLPYGIRRFVRAMTLKRLAGGRVADQLLRRTATGTWAFVADTEIIDLTDASQVFKLGTLAIFS
jgi:hypothetical protein